MNRLLLAFASLIFCFASAATAQTTQPAKKLPFTVSPETTRIIEPLLPDGRVDYAAALNAEFSKGITAENNAVIGLIELLGPDIVTEAALKWAKAQPGVKLKLDGRHLDYKPPDFYDMGLDERRRIEDITLSSPWTARDFPEYAEWLNDEAQPLDRLVLVVRLPRLFVPLLVDEKAGELPTSSLSMVGLTRASAKTLIRRAWLRAGGGNIRGAWNDMVAAHRLGALITQGPALMDRLVGDASVALAAESIARLAGSQVLRAEQAGMLLEELRELPAPEPYWSALDVGERYWGLSAIQQYSLRPRDYLAIPRLSDDPKKQKALDGKVVDLMERGLDWDAILVYFNEQTDTVVADMKRPPSQARWKALRELQEQLKQAYDRACEKLLNESIPADIDTRTRLATEYFVDDFQTNLPRLWLIRPQTSAMGDLAQLALALAAHHADKGEYPASLTALSPRYFKALPADPFAAEGAVYTYRRTDDGYVLYSVGPDAEDNQADPESDDIAVRVPMRAKPGS